MKEHNVLKLLIVATSISLVFSLAIPAIAIADDVTPPPPTEQPAWPPTAEPALTDDPNSVTSEEVTATEIPASLPELLDQLPDDTSVVVVMEGEFEPLATQDAANSFVMGDPIWCPEGVSPDPLVDGCTDSYPDLFSLIDDIDNGVISEPAENGTIWILSGTDSSLLDVSIDGAAFATWAGFALTLQGGWDGTPAGNFDGTSTFSVPIAIENWGGTVTINQLNITGADFTGLIVETSGDINLEDVSSSGNAAGGAELISSAGSVFMTGNNTFDDNNDTGLFVDSDRDINIENVTANGNGVGGIYGYGAELYSLGEVNLSGVNVFSGNYDSGLYVEADNNVVAGNVTANNNGVSGADIYSSGELSLTGTNVFNGNNESGLYAEISGNILTENMTANGNGAGSIYGYGAELYSLGEVSLSGVNIFSGNFYSGLYVEADNNVIAGNVTANNNGVSGADIYSSGDLSLTGTNVFTSNNETGLYAEISGNIVTENVTANGNGVGGIYGYGAELYSFGEVNLSGVNVFSGNYDSGLYVEADNDVVAENVTANSNGASGHGNGAELYSLGSFILTGINAFNNNYSNGLLADFAGEINIYDTDASGNGSNGLYLLTYGDATATCGKLAGNAAYELKAYISGVLTLNGVDFGGNSNDIQVDDAQLILNSNNCFSYPSNSDDEYDDDEGNSSNSENGGIYLETSENLPIRTVQAVGGQTITLDCDSYSGTHVVLLNRDGAYIPCPIDDDVNLYGVPVEALPRPLASSQKFLSSFALSISHDGQILTSVEVTDQITPFLTVFFSIPEIMKNEDLAILYWTGTRWVKLTDGLNLDEGRYVRKGGHKTDDGLYFEATVNFTGTFTLVYE